MRRVRTYRIVKAGNELATSIAGKQNKRVGSIFLPDRDPGPGREFSARKQTWPREPMGRNCEFAAWLHLAWELLPVCDVAVACGGRSAHIINWNTSELFWPSGIA